MGIRTNWRAIRHIETDNCPEDIKVYPNPCCEFREQSVFCITEGDNTATGEVLLSMAEFAEMLTLCKDGVIPIEDIFTNIENWNIEEQTGYLEQLIAMAYECASKQCNMVFDIG